VISTVLRSFLLIFVFITSLSGKNADSLSQKYSIFSNLVVKGEYDSAFYLGKELLLQPGFSAYNSWFYPKFSEVLLHNISDTAKSITPVFVRDFFKSARANDPDNSLPYYVSEAFLLDRYFDLGFKDIYPLYETALKLAGKQDDLIIQRLSEKAARADIKDTSTILTILDMSTYLLEKYPDEVKWGELISQLAGSEENLIKLRLKLHELKPESSSNTWALVSILIENEKYKDAFPYLVKLTRQSPEELKYWKSYTFTADKLKDEESTLTGYLNLIKLEPSVKDYYFNIGVLFEKKDNYGAAVKYFRKASEVGKGWGKALFYEGLVYENSARACGKLEFYDKCVYQLAYEKYLNALGYDSTLTELKNRIEDIEKYLPETSDYAATGFKSGDDIKIMGSCYIWIEEKLKIQ